MTALVGELRKYQQALVQMLLSTTLLPTDIINTFADALLPIMHADATYFGTHTLTKAHVSVLSCPYVPFFFIDLCLLAPFT